MKRGKVDDSQLYMIQGIPRNGRLCFVLQTEFQLVCICVYYNVSKTKNLLNCSYYDIVTCVSVINSPIENYL